MSAMARRFRRFPRLRVPRQHELLAAVLVLGIVVTAVAHALRASRQPGGPFAPAAVIAL